jgi:hypothetical protein
MLIKVKRHPVLVPTGCGEYGKVQPMMQKASNAPQKNVPAMLADTDYLFRQAKQGADAFLHAHPFPYLLLSSLVKLPCCHALHEGLGMADTPSVVRMLLWELSSSTLIRHFTTLTGKPPLLPDPFLVHGGKQVFSQGETVHEAPQEYVARHPQTQLQNVLRTEIFVAEVPDASFALELLDDESRVVASLPVGSGAALFLDSDNYRIRYRMEQPQQWRSLLAHYYINDQARILNGQEQPRASY